MTHVHAVHGWSVTYPILGQSRRFVSYAQNDIGRAFFKTRKEARMFLTERRGYPPSWRGKVARATLTLRVIERTSKRTTRRS